MPETEDHSAVVIALAEEFVERYRRGERPPLSEYTDRYPDVADEIREVFPAMALMENIALDDEAGSAARPATGSVPRPERLGEFRILREVGRGGMGVVYEAEQESLGRRVALKVLPKQMLLDPKLKKRFEREARAAAKLHHTNIVPVFGVGEHDGMLYYAMQFIHGQSLDEVLVELKRLAQSEVRDQRSEIRDSIMPRPVVAPSDAQRSVAPTDAELAAAHSPLPPGEGSGVRASATAPATNPSAADLALSLHTGRFQLTLIADSDSDDSLSRERPPTAPSAEKCGPLAPRAESQLAERTTLRAVPDHNGPSTLDSPPDTATARLSDTITLPGSAVLPGHSEHDAKAHGKATYWQSVARIGIQAAEALEHAHQHGILHRDIKPSNLLLDTAGTVWVTDFGLAKHTSPSSGGILTPHPSPSGRGAGGEGANLTATGDVLGTLRYMAPEVFEGKTDERSDVYSLGLTLYELLALRPAFDERDRHQLIRQVLHDSPPRLRTLNPAIPRDLETIVHKSIDRDPTHRYASADDLAEDLQRYLHDEPIRARRISPVIRLHRWCKRNPAIAALTTTIALLLIVAAILSSLAAVRFETLAHEKVQLAGDLSTALDDAQHNLELVREQEQIAQKNLTLANTEKQRAEDALQQVTAEQKRAEGNLDLALNALDAVYLDAIGRDRLLGEPATGPGDEKSPIPARPPLSDLERNLLKRGLTFYDRFARQNAKAPRAAGHTASAYYRVALLQSGLANYEAAQKAYQESINRFTALTKNEPDNHGHHFNLGLAYQGLAAAQREWKAAKVSQQRAERAFSQAIQLEPLKADYYMRRSASREALSDSRHAIEDAEQATELEPNNVQYHLKCRSLLQWATPTSYRNNERALEHCRRALALAPEDSQVHLQLGSILAFGFGRQEEGREHISKAIELDGNNAGAYAERAVSSQRQGDYSNALADINRAIEILPHHGYLYMCRADIYCAMKQYDKARADYAEAERLLPHFHLLYTRRAEMHMALGEYHGAVRDYTKAIERSPLSWLGYKSRSAAYFRLREYQKSLADIKTALELAHSETSTLWWWNGFTFTLRAEPLDESFRNGLLDLADKAVEASDNKAEVYANRARLYVVLGEFAKASEDFQTAIDFDRTKAVALNNFSWFLVTCPDPKFHDAPRAVQLAEKAAELAPERQYAWNTLGVARYRAGDRKAAIEALTKSMALAEGANLSFDTFFLAMAHWQLGEKDKAREWYDKAVAWMEKNAPDNDELVRFRQEAAGLLGIALPAVAPKPAEQQSEDRNQRSEVSPVGAAENSQGREPLEGKATNTHQP